MYKGNGGASYELFLLNTIVDGGGTAPERDPKSLFVTFT